MLTPDELAAIEQRSDAVLCSNLLHLCERGVIRSLKDVPRLLADLEAVTDELAAAKEEADRHKNNWLDVCDELKDLKACLHTYELMEEKHNATLERVRAALADPETPGDYETGDGYKVRYVATEGRTEWYDGNVITNRCTPGSRMPRWAVRLRPTVISVRAVRIAEMSPSEAAQHGFSDAVISPGAIGELYQCWERRWGKRYPWASNPWAWTMEVQRGND